MSARFEFRDATPAESFDLGDGTVHVWQALLDDFADKQSRLLELLSADERERGARFRFARDRSHFIIARGLLRLLLGRYLNSPPHLLSFSYSPYGKPSLVGESHCHALRFNVSHSHGVALYALVLRREVGVDVEYIRQEMASDSIAEDFFSPQEVAALRALPLAEQPAAFFNCWTRKEAVIKAMGEGLSYPLDGFEVSLSPKDPAALLNVRDNPQEASRWSLYALPVEEGYAASLAVEGRGCQLNCWRLRAVF